MSGWGHQLVVVTGRAQSSHIYIIYDEKAEGAYCNGLLSGVSSGLKVVKPGKD